MMKLPGWAEKDEFELFGNVTNECCCVCVCGVTNISSRRDNRGN